MLREVIAKNLAPGDRVALPFKKAATIASTKIGRQFVTVTWQEPYQPSRYELNQPVLLEGPEDA